MADEALKLLVLADTSKATTEFKKLEAEMEKVGTTTKESGVQASAGMQALNAMIAETRAGMDRLKSSVDAHRESIKASETDWKSFGKAISERGKDLEGIGKFLSASITLPLTAVGAALIATGVSFDAAFDKIRGKTGATGAELESLKGSFREVLAGVPQTADQVSSVIVTLNQRLGLTGKSLEDLARTELDLARVTGEDVNALVISTTKAFENWHIATADQIPTLDTLLKVSQATGIEVVKLADSAARFGPQFRAVGFNFNEAAVLIGQFEREGIGAEQLIRGLNKAVVELGKRGQSPKEVFGDLIQSIKTLNDQAAVDLASKLFGTRGAVAFVDAVKNGRFEIDALLKRIGESSETVAKAGADTLSFADKLEVLRNRAALALEPLGASLLNTFETSVFPAVQKAIGYFKDLADGFGKLPVPLQEAIFAFGGLAAALGPGIAGLGFMIEGIGKFIQFLPTATALIAGSGGFVPAIVLALPFLAAFAFAYAEIGKQEATNAQLRETVALVTRLNTAGRAAGLSNEQLAALRSDAERQAGAIGATKTADQIYEENVNKLLKTTGGLNKLGEVPIALTAADAKKASDARAGRLFTAADFAKETNGSELPSLEKRIRGFLTPERAEAQDKVFHIRFEEAQKEFENAEKVQFQLAELGMESRIALAKTETERKALEFQRDFAKFEETEIFKTATTEKQVELRMAFVQRAADIEEADRRRRREDRRDEIEILAAEVGAGGRGGIGARFAAEQANLAVRQAQEQRKAARRGDAAELADIEERQGLEVIRLHQRQYDEMFDRVKQQAEGVFDAIFLHGKKGFAGLLDYVKGVFITQLKNAFGDLVASLFLGRRPGPAGGGAGGGLFGGITSLFRGAAGGGGAGGGGGEFLGNLKSIFGLGGGGPFTPGGISTPPFIPSSVFAGVGGISAGAASLAGPAPAIVADAFGGLSLGAGGAGGAAAGTAAGTAGGAAGGFSLFGISGASLAAFFTNPITIGVGIALAATIAILKLRKTREDKFREEILRDFGINVPDKRLLKQIKQIGESMFGRDADKKRFETLRLDQVQGLLLNYASASGQDASRLPLYQRFYGRSAASRFDVGKGIPALGQGGIVRSPTFALIGEKGPEAVVPLNQVSTQPTIILNVSTDAAGFRAMLPAVQREMTKAWSNAVKRDLGTKDVRQAVFGV